jgi:lysozyme family protein
MSEQKLFELRIELLELEIARQKAPKPKEHVLASPIVLAIAGATVTALVSIIGNLFQLDANRKLEREKLESALILKATEAEAAEERIDGLQFLVKAGLIKDEDRKIASLKAIDVPQLQTSGAPPSGTTRPAPSEYRQLFDSAVLTGDSANVVAGYGKRLLQGRARYEELARKTGVPWFVIGILHIKETAGNFNVHLHNGDPLSQRTTHMPVGRPPTGSPPFKWEESAVDALTQERLTDVQHWSVEEVLYRMELWNGMGYRRRGINSPFLWAGSNHYRSGKLVSSGTFDSTATSRQIGAAVLLKFAIPKEELAKISVAASERGG